MKKLLIIFFLGIFLLGSVSAWEWDNVKFYDPETETITIINALGFGEDIAELKLITPHNNVVGGGYGKVAEFKIELFQNYTNVFGDMEFFDLKRGFEKINRDFDYKYLKRENVRVNDYETVCDSLGNGTAYNCHQEIIGDHFELQDNWYVWEGGEFYEGELTIGIFTEVQIGDRVEWLPTLFGVKIEEWAIWTADLNTNILGYWKLNESSGDLVDFVSSLNLSAINTPVYGAEGKIGTAVTMDSDDDNFQVATGSTFDFGTTGVFTYNFWVKRTDTGGGDDGQLLASGDYPTANGIAFSQNAAKVFIAAGGTQIFDGTITDNAYSMITVRRFTETNWSISVNGVQVGTFSSSKTVDGATMNLADARQNRHSIWIRDEIGIWDRALSAGEVTQLYNSGDGITWTDQFGAVINLNSPSDNFNTTNPTINFNVTITTPTGDLDNATLYINDVANETNSSGIEGFSVFTKIFTDQTSTWLVEGCNPSGCSNSTSRTFTVDTTSPSFVITSPDNSSAFLTIGNNIHLNYTITELNPDVCILQYDNSNTTIACGGSTELFTLANQKNLTLYANDTLGNTNSLIWKWLVPFFIESETFASTILEGSTATFTIGILTNGTDITLANLSYDNSPNIGSISSSGNNFSITKSLTTPTVDSDTNKTFFWKLTQGSSTTSVTEHNQTVTNFGVDACGVNTFTLFNFTIREETNQKIIDNQTAFNTQGKVDLQIKSFAGSTLITQFNSTYNQTNPFRVCLNSSLSSGEKFNMDVLVEYSANNFQVEFYNIQNETLNGSSLYQNISLFDLNSTLAQSFKLVVKDSSFLPLEDAIIEIHRKYLAEGVFKIVEIPKTDANGETIGSLVVEDVIYKFVIKKFGVVIGTFNNVRAICQTPVISTCFINFNAFSSGVVVPDYETLVDFNFTLGFNSTSRVISSVFVIPSGEVALIFLNVTMEDALGTKVCTDSLNSNMGTLSCVVPSNFGNATVSAKLFRNNVLQASGQVKMDQSPSDIYGVSLIVLGMFVFLSLMGAGLSDNPIFTLISLMVGVIALFSMNLVSSSTGFIAGATILFMVVAIILVIIKGSNRS